MTPGPWRKSSRSQSGGNANCVEARLTAASPELRDSKAPELGTLTVSRTDLTALLDSLRLITPKGPTMTPGPWRKSSRSQGAGNNCVEARLHAASPELRDSKAPELGTLTLSRTDLTALLDSLR